jgi:CRP-like cAMP-binding protein
MRDRERLAAGLERIEFARGQVLCLPGTSVEQVYFPTAGLASILARTGGGGTVAVATIGNEGVIGWPQSLVRRPSPHQVVAVVSGVALRARSDILCAEFERSESLAGALVRYTPCLLAQISQSVVCHRFHTVLQRLARWLLVVRDRVPSDTLRMTQRDIARVLGVPRTGVTEAAGELKTAGVIWYRHGRIVIVSRKRLEREACECYQARPSKGPRVGGHSGSNAGGPEARLATGLVNRRARRKGTPSGVAGDTML